MLLGENVLALSPMFITHSLQSNQVKGNPLLLPPPPVNRIPATISGLNIKTINSLM